jgi:K+ transporter
MSPFENPLRILVVFVFIEAALAALLWMHGQKWTLWAMAAAVGLCGTWLAAERVVVTEREKVAAVVYEAAAALERNSLPDLLNTIAANATNVRHDAQAILPQVSINRVSVKNNLAIDVYESRRPPFAKARFNVVIYAEPKAYAGPPGDAGRPYPRFCELTFSRENGNWRISDYKLHDPREGS